MMVDARDLTEVVGVVARSAAMLSCVLKVSLLLIANVQRMRRREARTEM
jgi:hypothetical protein